MLIDPAKAILNLVKATNPWEKPEELMAVFKSNYFTDSELIEILNHWEGKKSCLHRDIALYLVENKSAIWRTTRCGARGETRKFHWIVCDCFIRENKN